MKYRKEIRGKLFFSSDWHLGHVNISGPKQSKWADGYRNFESVHKMDHTIISEVNEMVGPDDTLVFAGDFYLGYKNLNDVADQITCRNILFVLGNHDRERDIIKTFGIMNVFDVLQIKSPEYKDVSYFISHYAHRCWNKSHHNEMIHLYGHSHNNLENDPWGKSMDIGVDSAYARYGRWRPYSEEDVLKEVDHRNPKIIDHHGKSDR